MREFVVWPANATHFRSVWCEIIRCKREAQREHLLLNDKRGMPSCMSDLEARVAKKKKNAKLDPPDIKD